MIREYIWEAEERRDAHGDVDELDKVADEAHDGEADGDRLGDLRELWVTSVQSCGLRLASTYPFVMA
jgi:hypothetical protein